MDSTGHPNRRQVLRGAAALGVLGAFATSADASAQDPGEAPKSDRDFVMAAGLTEAEADCWKATAEAAALFFALPELHSMDRQEVASAIHILQNKLLGRPTYRKYLEEAKRGRSR